MSKYILTIDAGTTGVTILLLNHKAEIIDKSYSEFTQFYPKPGWVEHNAEEIWDTTLSLIQTIFSRHSPNDIHSIGITNQRETTVLWNKANNKPIHNAIVWQCRRSSDICDNLKDSGFEQTIVSKTGLVVDSYFSGTKIKWMLENLPNVRKKAENGDILFGTIDTWLIWKLTNGSEHVTDHTNASRTLLYNIKTKSWDDELCEILSVPKALLPQIKNSASDFGVTSIDVLNAEIPINGVAGDQQSALYGQGGFSIGDTKCTYGTGCFLLSNIGDTIKKSEHGLLTTIACDAFGKPVYAIEGAVFIGGAVIQWIRDELQLITSASESETIATSISDNDGVYVVPAFVGLGAPYWKQEARGTITGLTRGTGKAHIVRSALESIAYQVHDLVKAIQKDTKIPISELLVDGGAATNNFLMQYQSDILNSAINRPQNIETTALGAGMLAGIGSGFWTSPEELIEIRQVDAIFNPKMDKDKREHLLKGWRIAIDKTIKN